MEGEGVGGRSEWEADPSTVGEVSTVGFHRETGDRPDTGAPTLRRTGVPGLHGVTRPAGSASGRSFGALPVPWGHRHVRLLWSTALTHHSPTYVILL